MVSEGHYKAALQHALKRSGFIHDHVKYEKCICKLVKKYFDKSKQWCQQLDRRQQFWDELSKAYPERANNVAIQEHSLAYARAVLARYRRGLRRRGPCTTPPTSNVTQPHQIPTERNSIPEPEVAVAEANLHHQLDNDDDPGSYGIGEKPFDLNKRPMIFTFGSPTIEIPDEPELQNDAQKVPPGTLFNISRVAQHFVRSLANDARACEEVEPTRPLSQLPSKHGRSARSSPTSRIGSPTTIVDYPVRSSTSLGPPAPLNTTNHDSDPVTVLRPPTTQPPTTPIPSTNNTASTSSPHRTDGQGPEPINEDYTVEEVRTFLSACVPPMTHHLSTFIRAGIKGNEYLKAIAGLSESGMEALWSSLGPSVSRVDLEILRSYLLSWKSRFEDTCRSRAP